jgi:bifunctional non-homologous end joining protein LigD
VPTCRAGIWTKSKCLNEAEFVIIGWSDPEGSRTLIGSLLLGYYSADGRLIYAGRVGTGMSQKTLRMLHEKLAPLAASKMPLEKPPPRKSRFGSPLALSRVHWVKPQLVAQVTYLTWTDEDLLRHAVFSVCGKTNRPKKCGGRLRLQHRDLAVSYFFSGRRDAAEIEMTFVISVGFRAAISFAMARLKSARL